MSVLDSLADREEAIALLSVKDDELLAEDLRYWAVASADAGAATTEAQRQVQVSHTQHLEASTWVALIADEMRSRREARRSSQ